MGAHIVHIAVGSGRNDTHAGKIPGAAHEGQFFAFQYDGHPRAGGHLVAVTQQTEAGHVGAGVDIGCTNDRFAGLGVEGCHMHPGFFQMLLRTQVGLCGSGKHARADGLGQHQHVTRSGTHVFQDAVGMDKAGDAQAVFGFVVLNGVSAGDDAAGLHRLVVTALQNLADGLQRQAVGHTQKVHGQLGQAAHGIDIAEGVCRGDLAEQIGIVHNGRKEIYRLDDGGIVADLVNTGVVAAVIAHKQVCVLHVGQSGQDGRKGTRPQFGSSAGGGSHLGQGDLFCHGTHLTILHS